MCVCVCLCVSLCALTVCDGSEALLARRVPHLHFDGFAPQLHSLQTEVDTDWAHHTSRGTQGMNARKRRQLTTHTHTATREANARDGGQAEAHALSRAAKRALLCARGTASLGRACSACERLAGCVVADPMVGMYSTENSFCVYLNSRLLLPAPESPSVSSRTIAGFDIAATAQQHEAGRR